MALCRRRGLTRDEPRRSPLRDGGAKLFCDLTQSWSDVGGGVRTYLLHKRRHILESTPHRHLMIVPGARDEIVEEERAVTVTIASPHVPGSPHYRLMLRNRAVRRALERFRPDLIECQDAYNLPWAAIASPQAPSRNGAGRRLHDRFSDGLCRAAAVEVRDRRRSRARWPGSATPIAGSLYRRFDAVFALSENGGAGKLRSLGIDSVDVVPLGVELGEFGPGSAATSGCARSWASATTSRCWSMSAGSTARRSRTWSSRPSGGFPHALGARLALIGEGPLKAEIAALGDERIVMPGYVKNRAELAALAGERRHLRVRAWPTRPSAFRSSRRRRQVCRSSASKRER